MTGIELFLLLIGAVFMIGSFFVSEKLSSSELNKIAELSDEELKKIINKGIDRASEQIDGLIDEKMDETSDIVERAIEKESNEKIMAISEYSDTVVESMKKTHDEIMFLYSMLNDKHTELTSMSGDLQRLAAAVRNIQENAMKMEKPAPQAVENKTLQYQAPQYTSVQQTKSVAVQPVMDEMESVEPAVEAEPAEEPVVSVVQKAESVADTTGSYADDMSENHNDMILQMYREGTSKVDIARKLGLGLGEVSLVIGLYKGEESL